MPQNGGLTQTNSNGMSANGQWPFLNLFKQAQNWSYRGTPTNPNVPQLPVTELDSNGYPTSIAVAGTTGVTAVFFLFPVAWYSGVYVITWDGGGTLLVPGNGTNTGFIPNTGYSFSNLTSTTSGGRFEFTLQNDSVLPTLSITATNAAPNNIRNIKIFRKVDETAVNAGNILGPDFKAAMALCKFGTLRSLGWLGSGGDGTNSCDIALWADRTPRTYFSYRAQMFIPSIYAGITTRNGNSYTVTGTATISDKLKQHILIDSAPSNVAQVTIASVTNSAVTSQPAVFTLTAHSLANGDIVTFLSPPAPLQGGVLYYALVVDPNSFQLSATRGGTAISTTAAGTNIAAGFWMSLSIDGGITFQPITAAEFPSSNNAFPAFAGNKPVAKKMATVTYDQVTGWWSFSSYMTADCGVVTGVPPEVFIDACAELGCHPHIVAPFLSMEVGSNVNAVTDFMPSWAAYIRDNYSWMKPVIEPPNETWNTGNTVFRASFYALGVGWKYWGVTNTGAIHEAYGKWASTLGQAMSAVFGNDRSKYSMICAVQTGAFATLNHTLDSRLMSAQYVSVNGGDPAYKWVDRVCAATYYYPLERHQCQELIDAYAYSVTYSGNTAQQSAIAEAYVATSSNGPTGGAEFSIQDVILFFTNLKAWAKGMPAGSTINGMLAYEGGYSPDYLGGNWSTNITGATQTNPCVLTLAATSSNTEKSSITGNPAVKGMSVAPSSVGGMTQLNGNTYTITKVGTADGLLANQIAINVDATVFSAYTSGGSISYVNSQTYSNNLRKAGKFTYTVGSVDYKLKQMYYALAEPGFVVENYSNFILAGTGGVWPMLDPDLTLGRTYQTDFIRLYNNRKRRVSW
jgi:hypothetical protein